MSYKPKEVQKGTIPNPDNIANKIPDKNSLKSVFLLGHEAEFNGDEQCHDFIATQITPEFNALTVDAAIELVFENNRLIKAFDIEAGDKIIRDLSDMELGLKYVDYPLNPILKILKTSDGHHQLGGDLPNNISFPDNNCIVPFQYLGYINLSLIHI